MSPRIQVRAATADPVPLENNPAKTIGAEAVSVPNTPYYRRRIKRGELVEVSS